LRHVYHCEATPYVSSRSSTTMGRGRRGMRERRGWWKNSSASGERVIGELGGTGSCYTAERDGEGEILLGGRRIYPKPPCLRPSFSSRFSTDDDRHLTYRVIVEKSRVTPRSSIARSLRNVHSRNEEKLVESGHPVNAIAQNLPDEPCGRIYVRIR